jgi:hypothetical protein
MDYLVRIAVFWVAVCAAILLLSRFPGSPLARIAFARLGPQPVAGEPRSRYLRRWAACAGTWFAQAASIWTACAIAWHLDPALGQSMGFLVFWLIVVSLLGAAAGVASLVALAVSLLARTRRAAGRRGACVCA